MEQLNVVKKLTEDLQGQKTTTKNLVVTESLKEELGYHRNENWTKTQIIKAITENQYLASALATQSSLNTKETYNTRLEMAHNCTID